MEILLSTSSNYLSKIIVKIILLIIALCAFYIFISWIKNKEKEHSVENVVESIIFLVLFSTLIVIVEKFFGMVGVYINMIIGVLLVRKSNIKI